MQQTNSGGSTPGEQGQQPLPPLFRLTLVPPLSDCEDVRGVKRGDLSGPPDLGLATLLALLKILLEPPILPNDYDITQFC